MNLRSLGLDAAWTPGADSGIALLERNGSRWRHLSSRAGTIAVLPELDEEPSVIAVDMPLAHHVITKRRYADNAVARTFGSAKASVHSPTIERPGAHGESISAILKGRGYRLATTREIARAKVFIEVFPLAALVRIMNVAERPRYKAAKSAAYWPKAPRAERMDQLRSEWLRIEEALNERIDALPSDLVPANFSDLTIRELKSFEDRLDGIICALVGALYLDDRAEPLGDESAAIWVPATGS